MEHIRQYDWCTSTPDNLYFVTEHELDNCVTEKILRNKFFNPLISSDSEEDENRGNKPALDWDSIFRKKNFDSSCHRIFVPGIRQIPPYPKLSVLSTHQQLQCLRVLCAQQPSILPDEFLPRPSKADQRVFQDLKDIYLKEQQEYIDWAKTLWTNGQCIRALRPKPVIESVYEAEFKVRANQMQAYPKIFEVVAQIPLDSKGQCEMVHLKNLIDVNILKLAEVKYPDKIKNRLTVLESCPLPEPCEKHPVRFVLPAEKTPSILPITEVHRELAQYAADNGVGFIASEGALRCLVERRAWALPVSVCAVTAPDGETTNVIVMGSEFSNKRENVLTRTFRAYRHLLEFAFVPQNEMEKLLKATGDEVKITTSNDDASSKANDNDWMDASSDDEGNLYIDFDESAETTETQNETKSTNKKVQDVFDTEMRSVDGTNESGCKQTEEEKENNKIIEGFGVYNCTCKDSIFERPPPRSFRKWQIRNNTTSEHHQIIVHCAHKFKNSSGEVLLEPILEYQADLGASKQTEDRIRSLALSLALRKNASVLNVRIDAQSGDVITIDELQQSALSELHGDRAGALAGALHTALDQLQGLVPGHYVMLHQPSHGDNGILYAPRDPAERDQRDQLRLRLESAQLAEADEAHSVRPPPTLTPALLPCHKFRKILPCAFTHYTNQVAKEHKKQASRQKTPPRALKEANLSTDWILGTAINEIEICNSDLERVQSWPRKRKGNKKAN